MRSFVAFVVAAFVAFAASSAEAKKLSDFPFFEYDVRFTNPECREYRYPAPVMSASGKKLVAKPKNVYCKQADTPASTNRAVSVHTKLVQWINDPSTKEIFFTYLSFSNREVGQALCSAVQHRNVKVRFILDSGSPDERQDPSKLAAAKYLLACKPKSGKAEDAPELALRGHVSGLGWAHNKLMIFNPGSKDRVRLVFSSGNLTSGVALHHENWNFVSTHRDSHFAQAHLCLAEGMWNHGSSGRDFRDFILACRREIKAPEEDDVKSFFVPGEGDEATEFLKNAISHSREISVAAHRFSYSALIGLLSARLERGGARVRLVTDDDTYWVGTTGAKVGPNLPNEFHQIQALAQHGLEVKWMETNHREHLLHHNKFLVFDNQAVFAGAGNLTGDAFTKNFENFYFITIPSVVRAFRAQYEHLWKDLATTSGDLPAKDVHP